MEKKYQVFVSSTYEDLHEERKKVMEALLQMNCFPVGMEYFNASDSSQWEVIKSLIRECDYYVLIVAGRYGSIEEESGKSYTQKEFEYAFEQGIPIISFVHKHPESLPGTKIESEQIKRNKLEDFKSSVKKRSCKFWNNADELASQVVLGLNNEIKIHPRIGLVKADEVSSADANKEILALKKENDELKALLKKNEETEPEGIERFQQGDDRISIRLKFYYIDEKIKPIDSTWNIIISTLTPLMIDECSENDLSMKLSLFLWPELCEKYKVEPSTCFVFNDDFQTIKIQLIALNIIKLSERKRTAKDSGTYWTLTPYGYRLMMQLKALKR